MEATKMSATLSPFESKIAQTIFDKLDKQISLVKAASFRAYENGNSEPAVDKKVVSPSPVVGAEEEIHKTNSDFLEESCIAEKKLALEGNFVKHSVSEEVISLEATLEYTKLTQEYSETKLESKNKEDQSSSASQEKFSEDVDFILNIIQKTKRSLKEDNEFAVLQEDTVKASIHLNKERQLKTDIAQTNKRIHNLKQDIRKRKIEMSLEEQAKVGEIGRLKDERFLIQSEGKETLKLTDSYFDAKSCNTTCSHRSQYEDEEKKIKQINQQIDRDVHCLAVMESWTDDFCKQIEAKIDEWKRKLRGDEMVMDMRIDAKRRAIKSQEELIKSLNETIAERLVELAPWEEEKEGERQQRLAHMRRYYSTRKIQRWWRAYMVKLKLYKRRKAKTKP